MSTLVSTVMMATLVVGPFYLSRALGLTAIVAGLSLSVGPLSAALAGVPAGRIVDRLGASGMLLVGLVGMACGSLALALMPIRAGIIGYLAPLTALTVGYALFQTANNTVIMAGAHPDRKGVVSALLSLSRNLGLITGASVMGAVFAFASATPDITTAHPESIASGMRMTFATASILIVIACGLAVGVRVAAGRTAPLSGVSP
jgi:MFS family permease